MKQTHLRLDFGHHRHRSRAGRDRGRPRSPGCIIEDGRYTPAAELFERTQNTYVRDTTKGSACRYVDTLFPHPYLAFVHHANPPCGIPWVNNVGLFGDDFPTVKRTDRYVILLTGGSVASQLGAERQAARAALSRGGAEQELRQPQRQAVPGAEWRRRRLEGAAVLHPVRALCHLGRCRGHARRLQRALFLLAGRRRSGSSGRSATSSRSIRSSPTRISAMPRSAG